MFGIEYLTEAVQALTAEVRIGNKRLKDATIAMETITQALYDIFQGPPSPTGPFRAKRLIREEDGMLIYEFDLPQLPDPNAPNAKDVTHGRMRFQFSGAEQPEIQTDKSALVSSEVAIPKNVTVTGDFAFVDDDGNVSLDPVELTEFVASDTESPPDPVGGFGAKFLREEPDVPA